MIPERAAKSLMLTEDGLARAEAVLLEEFAKRHDVSQGTDP